MINPNHLNRLMHIKTSIPFDFISYIELLAHA